MKLSKKQRIPGLYLFCNKKGCKSWYRYDSEVNCKCDSLVYKYKVHIPNADNRVRMKVLEAKNIDDALAECRKFRDDLKEMQYQKVATNDPVNITPILLVDCIDDFMAYIRDEGVPYHQRGNRTDSVIKRYERSLLYLCFALERNNIDTKILAFTTLNDNSVGYFEEYLLETMGLRNKTFNNYMAGVKKFSKYIREKYGIPGIDPFSAMRKRKVKASKKSIPFAEFERVCELATYENSFVKDNKGKVRNYYKPWLKSAFVLGLFTGGRREEVVKMKWSGIKLTRNGDFSSIEVPHFKLTRANRNSLEKDEEEIKSIPMNEDLKELLIYLGYEKYKDTDQYILAPEETCTRETIMDRITKTFNMYYRLLGNGKDLKFKNLRKTYITTLYLHRGDKTNLDTDHGGMGILHASYIDDNVVLEARREEYKKMGKIFTTKK